MASDESVAGSPHDGAEARRLIALFGGPAGAGKTTVARKWCASRARSVHIQLDDVRDLIVAGRADPQVVDPAQEQQYVDSVRACCALARSFAGAGYDVAVDDALEPGPVRMWWVPELASFDVRIVILRPSLDRVVARGQGRSKRVFEQHVRAQYEASKGWPNRITIDSTDLSVDATVRAARDILELSTLDEAVAEDQRRS